MRARLIIVMIVGLMTLSGCYHTKTRQHDAYTTTNAINYADSSFYSTHHYAQNYNFVVKSDTLSLLRQQPEEKLNGLHTDSFLVKRGDHLVVVDIRLLKNDPTDSVWIQLARDQYTFGWIHESRLMQSVVPDDPISQFISTFSDTHLQQATVYDKRKNKTGLKGRIFAFVQIRTANRKSSELKNRTIYAQNYKQQQPTTV